MKPESPTACRLGRKRGGGESGRERAREGERGREREREGERGREREGEGKGKKIESVP